MNLRRGAQSKGRDSSRDDGPTDEDIEAFDNVTRPCPQCGTSLYDDVAVCYKCGYAITGRDEGKPSAIPTFKIIAVILIILMVLALAGKFPR